jgi:hypothetical protein
MYGYDRGLIWLIESAHIQKKKKNKKLATQTHILYTHNSKHSVIIFVMENLNNIEQMSL